jgi:hypothetical protein
MFTYRPQLPNLQCPTYSSRVLHPGVTRQDKVGIDLAPLDACSPEGNAIRYIPGGQEVPALVCAMWTSLVLNYVTYARRFPQTPPPKSVWPTEVELARDLQEKCLNLHSIWGIVENLGDMHQAKFQLQKIAAWEQLPVAIAEGHCVMVGGSVYTNFVSALHSGIVPMPTPSDGLLGGHIVNVVSFDPKTDMATAIGNLGMQVGNSGLFKMRGSYLRNLDINRDFYILTVERA